MWENSPKTHRKFVKKSNLPRITEKKIDENSERIQWKLELRTDVVVDGPVELTQLFPPNMSVRMTNLMVVGLDGRGLSPELIRFLRKTEFLSNFLCKNEEHKIVFTALTERGEVESPQAGEFYRNETVSNIWDESSKNTDTKNSHTDTRVQIAASSENFLRNFLIFDMNFRAKTDF